MDKETFDKFVKENCEWRVKEFTAKYAKKNKTVDHIDDTMAWRCVAREQVCPDCNKSVVGRIVQIKIFGLGTPKQRWEKKCSNCKHFLSRK